MIQLPSQQGHSAKALAGVALDSALPQARVSRTDAREMPQSVHSELTLSICWDSLLGDPECRRGNGVAFTASDKPGN